MKCPPLIMLFSIRGCTPARRRSPTPRRLLNTGAMTSSSSAPTPSPAPAATSLCLLTRLSEGGRRELLLGLKKTGFGAGKFVGPGGHIEPGETPAEAAVRGGHEESGP